MGVGSPKQGPQLKPVLLLLLLLAACSAGVDALFSFNDEAPYTAPVLGSSQALFLKRSNVDFVSVATKSSVESNRKFINYYKVTCFTRPERNPESPLRVNGGPGVELLFEDFKTMHRELEKNFSELMLAIEAPKQNDDSLTKWLNDVLFKVDNEDFQADSYIKFFCNHQQLLWVTLEVPTEGEAGRGGCPYGFSRVVAWAEVDPNPPAGGRRATRKLKTYSPRVDLIAASGLNVIFTPRFLAEAAVSPPPFWKLTTQLVLRGDHRPPFEIFQEGFSPRLSFKDPIDTVEQWVAAKIDEVAHLGSKYFVSASVHPNVAAHFAKMNIGFVYLVMARDGLFISTPNDERGDTEATVLLVNGAPSWDVYAARQVLAGEGFVGPVFFNRKFHTSHDLPTLHAAVKDFFCLDSVVADREFESHVGFEGL
eukprot:gnl/Hemi2/20245_TR6715_c0_g1_i1.p1 gnl/Hemi2/20245_TR6715_c0_g1~~gnl/Hemi2/20245_TR6715_c0_g1_i1.p1  ORF type:complete len:423 (-),score=102.15 gnl/Hemi2/20245_TR6715_c0_g1_i1:19-1287(-)